MTPVRYRSAGPLDGAGLLRVHVDAIRAVPTVFYSDEVKASWAHGLSPEGYARSMAAGEEFEVAINVAGAIVGFCGVKDGCIYGLYVHPSAQGRGIGRRLTAGGERRAAIQRPSASIWPLDASLNAVPFYESIGYRLTAIREMPTRGGLVRQAADMEKPR